MSEILTMRGRELVGYIPTRIWRGWACFSGLCTPIYHRCPCWTMWLSISQHGNELLRLLPRLQSWWVCSLPSLFVSERQKTLRSIFTWCLVPSWTGFNHSPAKYWLLSWFLLTEFSPDLVCPCIKECDLSIAGWKSLLAPEQGWSTTWKLNRTGVLLLLCATLFQPDPLKSNFLSAENFFWPQPYW